MALSFADLKKNRNKNNERLAEEMAKARSGNKYEADKRYWYPGVDKTGNGYAVIRFLPAPMGEDFPYVRLWRHHFKGPTGKYYSENCLSTLGQPDPVLDFNSELWNQDSDDESPAKKQARAQARKVEYHANVLVINDKANPENNGKVFLFRFGTKLFEKLANAMNPKIEDEEPLNPFDPWSGADFRIVIQTKGEFRNYDDSKFANPAPMFGGDDEKIEETWKQVYPLAEIVEPKKFKSYEELKAKLDLVLGKGTNPSRIVSKPIAEDAADEPEQDEEVPQTTVSFVKDKPAPARVTTEDDDDDEELAYYKKLTHR
jgi:hypothetical protein